MYDTLEAAIYAAREAPQIILTIDVDNRNKATLDALYNTLRYAIVQLNKLLEPVGFE